MNSALNCTRKPISHESQSDERDLGFQVQFNAEFTSQVMKFPIKFLITFFMCDIGFRVQFNAEFPCQVMNFPIDFLITFFIFAYVSNPRLLAGTGKGLFVVVGQTGATIETASHQTSLNKIDNINTLRKQI